MNSPTTPDPAWLDAQYNNRALVPDHGRYFERWARDSAVARERLPGLLNLAYGHGAGETLDVFPAQRRDNDPLAPVLVFIHGGYWRSLDKSDHSFLAPAFVSQGACVVIPNYALCPAVTIPQITLQMVEALAWVHRHIAVHGGDPRRISVVGHSAGGHLAAMLMVCEWERHAPDLPPDLVNNALSISGVFDLEPLRHTPFLKDSLRLTPQAVRMASPAGLPKEWPDAQDERGVLLSVAGGSESQEFQRQCRLIREAWGEASVPVCELLPGLNHFSVLDALVQPGHRLHHLARQLLDLT
ncbi:MAG: alpha/beta hydrolase [Hydrogenophaga sp.]|nr:alpha/beta hydrolase [Hydrogenophaga sp.]